MPDPPPSAPKRPKPEREDRAERAPQPSGAAARPRPDARPDARAAGSGERPGTIAETDEAAAIRPDAEEPGSTDSEEAGAGTIGAEEPSTEAAVDAAAAANGAAGDGASQTADAVALALLAAPTPTAGHESAQAAMTAAAMPSAAGEDAAASGVGEKATAAGAADAAARDPSKAAAPAASLADGAQPFAAAASRGEAGAPGADGQTAPAPDAPAPGTGETQGKADAQGNGEQQGKGDGPGKGDAQGHQLAAAFDALKRAAEGASGVDAAKGDAAEAAQPLPQAKAGDAPLPSALPRETQPLLLPRALPPAAIPVEIGLRALQGLKEFQIRLDPAELGRVDVRLELGDDRSVTARVVVDRVETLHLLQREARTLERAFEQAGLKSSEGGIDITLRDPGQQSQRERGEGMAGDGAFGRRAGPAQGDAAEIKPIILRRSLHAGGLDLSI